MANEFIIGILYDRHANLQITGRENVVTLPVKVTTGEYV
jgi:hypothetical protein